MTAWQPSTAPPSPASSTDFRRASAAISNTAVYSIMLQGLIAVTLAVCLVSMASAQPLLLPAGATAAFTTAGGLVLTSAAGTVTTIPTSSLILGKLAVAKKLAILKLLADQQQ